MAKQVSWLSIDSRMPHDPKLAKFPDNDYRWAWACLLCLEKQGELEDQDVSGFFHYCHIGSKKFEEILEKLQEVGLLDNSFRPKDFSKWQDRVQSGERVRRHRAKVTPCNGNVTPCNAGKQNRTQMTPSETETETETETNTDKKNTESPCPKSGDLVAAKPDPKIFEPEVVRLGNLLGQRILDNDPKARIPTTEKQKANWLDSIEKLHRIDGRAWLEIEQVINWCQDDGFWKGNILSGLKLRKQFPQLWAKMRSNEGRKLSGQDLVDRNRRVLDEISRKAEYEKEPI